MLCLIPVPKQFVDQSGVPLTYGTVDILTSGSSLRASVYADALGESLLPNPVELDSHGSWTAFVDPSLALDYIVKDEEGNTIFSYRSVKAGEGSSSTANIEFNSPNDTIEINERQIGGMRRVDLDVKDGASTPFTAGEGIDISNHQISVRHGAGLEINDVNELQVSSSLRNRVTSLQNQIDIHEISPEAHMDIREAIEDLNIDIDPALDAESANPVENRVVTNAMNSKQDQLTEMTDGEISDLIESLN